MSTKKDKPYEISDAKWFGNESNGVGSKWIVQNEEQISKRYCCYFGGGETVNVKGNEIVVKGEINVGEIRFNLFGLTSPYVTVFDSRNLKKIIKIYSTFHSPALFEPYYKHFKEEEFQSRFGKMFIQRIGSCLNYRFEEEKYLNAWEREI